MVILLGDAALVLKDFKDDCISLTVTSPPYDNLRTYGGHSFNFEVIAKELYRITKDGGAVVWIVGDGTTEGSETGTSFKQALYFKEIGFKLHDTMIYQKNNFAKPSINRYHQTFEYMFIFCKDYLKTFNPITDRRVKYSGVVRTSKLREADGSMSEHIGRYGRYGMRHNVWQYDVGKGLEGLDDYAAQHPAAFPSTLVLDHINSWSNEGDLILDPFAGSGTTLKAAQQLNRKWIGIEINPDYVALAKKRLTPYVQQQRLESFQIF